MKHELDGKGLTFFRLKESSTESEIETDLLRICNSIGKLRHHPHSKDNGITYICPTKNHDQIEVGNGFSNNALPLHSDGSAHRSPPKYMLFFCIENSTIGGESIFNPRSGGQQSPYLTAKSGGMIETYDEFDELERYLRG